ncbi:MAG: hypothetical protein ACE5I1_19430 [bacterium]
MRLLANIKFKTQDGWSLKYQAIIDRGSPINIIPKIIWEETINRFKLTNKVSLDGIGPGSVAGYIGEVTTRISHGKKISPPFTMKAFLLESDSAPLILGFEDFLYRENMKWIRLNPPQGSIILNTGDYMQRITNDPPALDHAPGEQVDRGEHVWQAARHHSDGSLRLGRRNTRSAARFGRAEIRADLRCEISHADHE